MQISTENQEKKIRHYKQTHKIVIIKSMFGIRHRLLITIVNIFEELNNKWESFRKNRNYYKYENGTKWKKQ